MMKSDLKVCDECFARICKLSAGAGRLWMDICTMTEGHLILALKSDEFEELRILEMLGHIVTTDKREHIMIRVLGHPATYFCNGDCDG